MKILHVIANLSPRKGGPSEAALLMCRALAKLGHTVSLYTTNEDGKGILDVPLDRPVIKDGVTIRYFPIGKFRRWGVSFSLGRALRNDMANFDIVHIHSLYLYHTSEACSACRRLGIPYILRPHGTLDPFLRRKSKFKKAVYNALIENRNLNKAAAVHYTAEDEMKLAHIPLGLKSRAIVVPLGIDLSQFSNLPMRGRFRSQMVGNTSKRIILFLGRINFKKGLDLLAKAYGKIARNRNDVHLVIAGPDEEGFGKKVRAWLSAEEVLERVTFTGMLLGQDKLDALADADIFVLPSYTENFGITVAEAMACNLPVLITDKVNIHQQVKRWEAGYVIDCDPDHLATGLMRMLDDDELCARLRRNGRRLVSAEFSIDVMGKRLEWAYETILNGWRLKTT
ncbi:glycosyltransferase [Thermodesulfobacteriota bacterium]